MEEIDYEGLKKRGFLKQRQEGFFILRTRMANGVYGKKQLGEINRIAKEYGLGFVHATVRQGLEIPFIKYADIPKVEAHLKVSGVLTGTSGARLRTTTSCPGNNWCKSGLVDTFALAEKIEKELNLVCGLDLPHKFKIAISGCPNTCTRPQQSEIGIHGQPYQEDGRLKFGYAVYLGGCGGKTPRLGFKLEKVFSIEEVLTLIGAVVKFYQAHAAPRQRLALLIEKVGREEFLKAVGVG